MQGEDGIYYEVDSCRICNGEMSSMLNLGDIYPSNFTLGGTGDVAVPLELMKCLRCGLVQLRHTVNRDLMYRKYWYKSGANGSMVNSLKDVHRAAINMHPAGLGETFNVIDIGCNDGTLLNFFDPERYFRIGYDPARNLNPKIDMFFNDYFGGCSIGADIITSIAMFYDIDDPHEFVENIRNTLVDDGIWIVQMTDLLSMLSLNAFDNIVHEHLLYYSLGSVIYLIGQHDLEVFHVEDNDVNGGSIRLFISHKGKRPINSIVESVLAVERSIINNSKFDEFSARVNECRDTLKEFIAGKRVGILGGSTKGNTLLQYYGIGPNDVIGIAEINPDKFGMKTVGTKIPIYSDEDVFSRNPDYMLVLPWHFIDYFIVKYKAYLDGGGKFIVPLPEPAIYGGDGCKELIR